MISPLHSCSDHQILADTDAIVVQDRRLTLRLLVHLIEIERRKLHLMLGHASMFDYCTTRLRFSEPAAARRLRTARCLSRFPQLHGLLETGDVNLSTVSMVSRLMTPANADDILSRICGKSRREVERLIAEREPRVTLPVDRVRAIVIPVTRPPHCVTVAGDSEISPTRDVEALGDHRAPTTANPDHEHRSVIQFTAHDGFMAKVERARALVWHRLPRATFEQLFDLALDELIARRDPAARHKRREGRSVATRPSDVRHDARRDDNAGQRYVRAAVRDQVFVRDGFRCTYVSRDGRWCAATVSLQVDHIRPVARGGASTSENLRILCAQHNRLEGERLTGRGAPVAT